MHSEFNKKENQRLKGTYIVLEAAYKQLAVKEAPILIFIDGAHEEIEIGYGGIM